MSDHLQAAIAAGQAEGKAALYFGCLYRPGHYLFRPDGRQVRHRDYPSLCWDLGLMDGGLLKNGGRTDVYDGYVFWTCGGRSFWYAFYWWDRSGDSRSNSSSGFYVRGFGWPEAHEAFDYACKQFPMIVERQRHPLILQVRTYG